MKIADALREQIARWDERRQQDDIDVVQEQIVWWRRNGFTPDFCVLMMTGSAMVRRRAPNWVNVFDIAVVAYGEIKRHRLVSFGLVKQ